MRRRVRAGEHAGEPRSAGLGDRRVGADASERATRGDAGPSGDQRSPGIEARGRERAHGGDDAPGRGGAAVRVRAPLVRDVEGDRG